MNGQPTRPGTRLTPEQVAGLILWWTWTDPRVPAAICWAEGQGNTSQYRPASANPGGGNDRGMWQMNDKPTAFASVPDEIAYHPVRATMVVHTYTRGGDPARWGPWNWGPNAYRGADRARVIDFAYWDAVLARAVDPYWLLYDANHDMLSYDVQAVKLPPASTPPYVSSLPTPPLRVGSTGPTVTALQRQLVVEGAWPGGGLDAYFGRRCKSGVATVQQMLVNLGILRSGEYADGVYDRATATAWDRLRCYVWVSRYRSVTPA